MRFAIGDEIDADGLMLTDSSTNTVPAVKFKRLNPKTMMREWAITATSAAVAHGARTTGMALLHRAPSVPSRKYVHIVVRL